MDWKEFIAQIITQIAWPVTALVFLFLLKDKLGDMLPRIEKFRHKDTEIAFSKAMNEVVEKAAEIEEKGEVLPADLVAEEQRLSKYIDFSPNGVIHQAYALVDRELLKIYDGYLQGEARKPIRVKDAVMIRADLGFDEDLQSEIKKIQSIRRMTMTNPTQLISQEQASSYVELCMNVVAKIRSGTANMSRKKGAQRARATS